MSGDRPVQQIDELFLDQLAVDAGKIGIRRGTGSDKNAAESTSHGRSGGVEPGGGVPESR